MMGDCKLKIASAAAEQIELQAKHIRSPAAPQLPICNLQFAICNLQFAICNAFNREANECP